MEKMYDYLRKVLRNEQKFSPKKVLDLGAWNGRWTREVKEFWPDAHYTCIEAGEKHRQRLRLCADKIYIAVLGNENKNVEMHLRQIRKGPDATKVTYTKGSNIFGSAPKFPAYTSEVRKMATLESLVGEEASYDFIKQDVQGAELLVMQGSPEIFKRAKYVLNEVNIEKDPNHPVIPSIKEMDLYMKTLGFNNGEIIDEHPLHKQVDKLYFK
jgi:FkbM family methyltransferase